MLFFLLIFLQVLHIYWFKHIAKMFFKFTAAGKVMEVQMAWEIESLSLCIIVISPLCKCLLNVCFIFPA